MFSPKQDFNGHQSPLKSFFLTEGFNPSAHFCVTPSLGHPKSDGLHFSVLLKKTGHPKVWFRRGTLYMHLCHKITAYENSTFPFKKT